MAFTENQTYNLNIARQKITKKSKITYIHTLILVYLYIINSFLIELLDFLNHILYPLAEVI